MYNEMEGLIWKQVFLFSNGPESLVWSKHAPKEEDVHRLGCKREAEKRTAKSHFRYSGYISAHVGDIRAIRTAAGHGFEVVHAPKEGTSHAEINYLLRPGIQKLKPAEKSDLKESLKKCFGDLVAHSCDQ